jgi:hypothetical protein
MKRFVFLLSMVSGATLCGTLLERWGRNGSERGLLAEPARFRKLRTRWRRTESGANYSPFRAPAQFMPCGGLWRTGLRRRQFINCRRVYEAMRMQKVEGTPRRYGRGATISHYHRHRASSR